MSESIEYDAAKDLACWFGLSYASFLVLPRVLMQDMPPEWQADQDAALAAELSPSGSRRDI